MTFPCPIGVHRIAFLRSVARRTSSAITILATVAAMATGCHSDVHIDGPSDVVSSLGAVPIPSAAAGAATPTAAPGHPALLAIGQPVAATLPGGVDVDATALGPEQVPGAASAAANGRPNARIDAVITLRVRSVHGNVDIDAAELSSRDQTGAVIALRPEGPRRVPVAGGTGADVRVVGTFRSGAAQVTWRHGGHVLAVWTFNIELD